MKSTLTQWVLLLAGASLSAARPPVHQQPLGSPEPPSVGSKASGTPYTPGHRDPYDGKTDPIRQHLDPLPWRNGKGASVLGPYNRDRSRQSPDMVRPPSTDHGSLSNMRWSFTDSHTRIEVRPCP